VGGRYNLHGYVARVYVSGGGQGLAQPQGALLAAVQYPGSDFCIEALQEAFGRYGTPEIFNTDQGSQFTSNGFTQVLNDRDIAISMDSRGRCQDNIFIERLWWTIKHHNRHLHCFGSGSESREGLNDWIRFYNHQRSHSSLDDRTPDEVSYGWPHPFAGAKIFDGFDCAVLLTTCNNSCLTPCHC
jgi:hypothetical protein